MPGEANRGGDERPFGWYVNCGMPALGELAAVPLHFLFREADAIIEAYQTGVPRLRELFGPDVEVCHPGWAHICYGHVNTLGCQFVFPDDSDVGVVPVYPSLNEGIDALQNEIDFAGSGMFPFYLALWAKLRNAFPEHQVPFAGLEAEGPLTTAWLLRGHDFFLDIHDNRDRAKAFLGAVTDSVIGYKRLLASINGQPEFSGEGADIADDGASMIHPDLWPELVVPSLDQYYRGTTGGQRRAHIENLSVGHLRHLNELGIGLFDPSVSPKLTPALVRDHARIPFLWRLSAMQLREMSEEQVERWVFASAADGPTSVFFHIERITCNAPSAGKVRTFIRAARRAEQLLAEGCPREELRGRCRV